MTSLSFSASFAVRIVTGALCLSILVPLTAHADTYQRERSITRRWAPTYGIAHVAKVDQLNSNLLWKLRWDESYTQLELDGRHRAFEVKSEVDYRFADSYNGFSSSTFPTGARFYRDTQVGDPITSTNLDYSSGDRVSVPASRDGHVG